MIQEETMDDLHLDIFLPLSIAEIKEAIEKV